jgi:hypothetical protein
VIEGAISYPFPLAGNPSVEIVQEGDSPTSHCPGTSTSPSAAPGFLCIYVAFVGGASSVSWYAADDGSGDASHGVVVYSFSTGSSGTNEASGTWALTAP